jgi:hypothetical protein
MNTMDDIYDAVLEYEEESNLQDPSAPEEMEDITLTPEELEYLEKEGDNLPPLPEGKYMSQSMLNFARTVTKAYRLCYFQFVHFVDHAQSLCPDVLGYCSRNNIDQFFQVVISKRTMTPAVNRRFVAAIQKYSDFWEERTGFQVFSEVVKKALEDAKACKKRLHSQFSAHVDAHKHHPTLHHSPEQESRMIEEAFRSNIHSKVGFLPMGINFLISWNCAMQGFTRGDEVRSCRLADLCHESNYGPWRLTEDGLTAVRQESRPHGNLSLIQQPFGTKIMSSKARVVGFFHHKDWQRCATSVIAFSIMARFESMTTYQLETLFSVGENNVPNWYSYYLIDWRDYDSMADAFKKFFNLAGVAYTKLTHTRKLGINRAQQMGADRENIILLSKHTTHRVDTSYLPELPYNAMLACAGFDVFRREEYYLPRSYAQVPAGWIDKVFPYLNTWREQVNEVWGYDKGLAAKKFVNFMLPFLAEVIVQDGMYLISMYPDHPYTSLLLQKLGTGGYEAWASQTRESVREREMIIEENLREDRRYKAILRTVERTVLKVTNLELKIDSLTSVVNQLKDIILHHRNVSVNAIIETPQTAHATSTLVHNMSPVDLNATSF